ncbi:MAG: C-terminal binding protein [Burkholderiaceae bacterium]
MKVLFTDNQMRDPDVERKVLNDAGIELLESHCRTEDEVIAQAADCDALLITYAPVGEKVFSALPKIGLCSRMGAGFDTIDIAAAARHGVWVANSPDYGVGEVSLHALTMLLGVIRNIVRFDRDIHGGNWHHSTTGSIPRAQDLTVGVLGLGRIGKRFAHYAQPIFKKVIAHDPYLIEGDFPQYVEKVGLEELFERADAISIHCLLNDETKSMVSDRLLGLMKPGSYLVNTARGAVIDIDALTRAVQADRFAGVGLDVLPVEPVPAGHPLLDDPRVIFSPHAAFYSVQAEIELRRKTAQNIVTWMKTGRPDYPVVTGNRLPPNLKS